jgi:hypothetical protein
MSVEPLPHVEPPPTAIEPSPEPLHDGKLRFFRALSFPFRDRPWHWGFNLALIVLAQYVPFLGPILAQGWSKEVARRVRAGDPHPLPRWPTFWGYFKGCWAVWFVYTIPGLILAAIVFANTVWSIITQIWKHSPKVINWINGTPNPEPAEPLTTQALWDMSVNLVVSTVVQKSIIFSISTFLIVLAHLMWCGGMVRYLNRGSFWCFFHPLQNLWLVLRYWRTFFLVLVFWVVIQTLLWSSDGLLGLLAPVTFGITGFLVPLLFPIAFWFLGHLYGQVALKVAHDSK